MDIKLVVVGGKQAGTEIAVPGPKFLIGRGAECQLRPRSNIVSRKHCAIVMGVASATLEDYGSTNGTFVNGEKVEQHRELKNGDRIKIGQLELEVRLGVGADAKKSQSKGHHAKDSAHKVAAFAPDDDLDISGWLEEEDEQQNIVSSSDKPSGLHDTKLGNKLDETVAVPPAEPVKQAKEKPDKSVKIVGQFQRAAKPTAESSRDAATDALKKLLTKRK